MSMPHLPSRIRRVVFAGLTGGAALGLSACATIMHGTTQQVSIGSTPAGASVRVDGQTAGHTPLVAQLKRKEQHLVRIELDGYQPFDLTLKRSTSGWVWGNILFGGLIGLAVDAGTGGMYQLRPEEVESTLSLSTAQVSGDSDRLVIAVVLQPDDRWQKIGQLVVDGER